MLADLGAYAIRFALFVASCVVLALAGVFLVAIFPVALAANFATTGNPARAWRETVEIYRPARRRT